MINQVSTLANPIDKYMPIITVFLSVSLSAIVSWLIARSGRKHATRLNLYERRMKIYNSCYVAIRETMYSFSVVPITPIEYFDGNENLLKNLVFAERESIRILSDMHVDILELEKIVHRINYLQHFISAKFGYEPTTEDIKKREEEVARYTTELNGLNNKFFNEYKLDGVFMKKFNDAIAIKG